ncbi:MAG: Hsp70 family protein, partial [Myxococcota bacterium]
DTSGIQELGGDDFDALLLEMALEAIGLPKDITHPRLPALLDECRSAKEGVGPTTKRIVLELAALGREAPDAPVVLAVKDYYERLRPYVEHTMRALAEVMAPGSEGGAERVRDLDGLKVQAAEAGVAGVYVVGGGSGLPVVPRLLRERFAHRVQRSVYPSASTAIGLAIAADDEHPGPTLRERFTRHLGVFREKEAGHGVVFDQIFSRGTPMPSQDGPPLVKTRTYRAAHNIGYFRFVECAALGDGLEPVGDISPHGEVRFPFLREVRHDPLDRTPIERLSGDGPMIEERYEVDGTGIIAVTIRDLDDGYTQRYVLG